MPDCHAVSDKKIVLVIPTFNAGQDLEVLFESIAQQSLQPDCIMVIDSSSTDETPVLLDQYCKKYHEREKKKPVLHVHNIPASTFDHGGTRALATVLLAADIYIYLTQDVILASVDTLYFLVSGLLSDENIGCAYGRQLPKKNANPLAIHGRLCNYPKMGYVRWYADRKQYGIKTCFNSDNLAAYRSDILQKIGGFPFHIMTGEDMYVAAKMQQQGYGIRYIAEAVIYHSHNQTFSQEFHRYFSIGVFHARQYWLVKEFSNANAAGMHFVWSEWRYLWRTGARRWIPRAIIATFVKYFSYQLGLHEKWIPFFLRQRFGVNKNFWFQLS